MAETPKVIARWTEYGVFNPDHAINFIKDELAIRDVSGLTNGKIQEVRVTGQHPLVDIAGAYAAGGDAKVHGILPAVSVTIASTADESATQGEGTRVSNEVTREFLAKIKSFPIETRHMEGLITNKQISTIENFLTTKNIPMVLAQTSGEWMRENMMVGVWAETTLERDILARLMRSVLKDYRRNLGKTRNVKADQPLSSTGALTNINFARVLHGEEISISYLNWYENFTIIDEKPLDVDLPVNVEVAFKAKGTDDKYATTTEPVKFYPDGGQ